MLLPLNIKNYRFYTVRAHLFLSHHITTMAKREGAKKNLLVIRGSVLLCYSVKKKEKNIKRARPKIQNDRMALKKMYTVMKILAVHSFSNKNVKTDSSLKKEEKKVEEPQKSSLFSGRITKRDGGKRPDH